jgi:hypothetical protein
VSVEYMVRQLDTLIVCRVGSICECSLSQRRNPVAVGEYRRAIEWPIPRNRNVPCEVHVVVIVLEFAPLRVVLRIVLVSN